MSILLFLIFLYVPYETLNSPYFKSASLVLATSCICVCVCVVVSVCEIESSAQNAFASPHIKGKVHPKMKFL